MPTENYQNPTWTRYVTTIGPASSSPEVLEGLIRAGANLIRNNFAHCKYDEYRERRKLVQEISQRLGVKVEMLGDVQGANIRIGTFPNEGSPDEGIVLEPGKEYTWYTAAAEQPAPNPELLINDKTLHLDVKVGEPISFADGAFEGEIIKVEGPYITIRMINGGRLISRKSINVPDTHLTSSPITDKDRADIAFLLETGVEWIGLSFVASRKDIDEVREMIGDRPTKIITKVERRLAIKNLVEIVEASDAIMIARGDLGIEMPLEDVPILQRRMIALCENMGKPVITATQMLISMTDSLRPTRAEVSDVANAVFARSDALMLSEETAKGKDPINALETMVKIARRVEEYMYNRPNFFEESW